MKKVFVFMGLVVVSVFSIFAQTTILVGKELFVAENLRLRAEESLSSAIVTTMSVNTKVKILSVGKTDTIDGIKSNWVQVEVQNGAKDTSGKMITPNAKGWCYGGYLSEKQKQFVSCRYFMTVDDKVSYVNILLGGDNYDAAENPGHQKNENYSCLFFNYPANRFASGTYQGFFEGVQFENGEKIDFKIKKPVHITITGTKIRIETEVNLYEGVTLTSNLKPIFYEGTYEKANYNSFWR